MSRPRLDDPAALAAYKRELRGLYKPWRWLGLALIVAGVAIMFLRDGQFDRLSIGMVAVGWIVLIGVIVQRTRYHRRRMAEPPA
jgi:drug/metabolite transporter (DMT)-like permease